MIETKRSLFDNLQNFFGFDNFKGEQEAIITNILAGNDTFVIMPTGGGKSMCYQLPALMSEGTAIVISPLIALMKNQVDQLRAFGGADSGVTGFSFAKRSHIVGHLSVDIALRVRSGQPRPVRSAESGPVSPSRPGDRPAAAAPAG